MGRRKQLLRMLPQAMGMVIMVRKDTEREFELWDVDLLAREAVALAQSMIRELRQAEQPERVN